MGKLCKKLVVYLDQNFLSEMAKAGQGKRVAAEFVDVYELLHRGFIDEKIAVPRSIFHDLESALAPGLRDNIRSYRGYLGQIGLRHPLELRQYEILRAVRGFRGEPPVDPSFEVLFTDDPDQRVQRFNVDVNFDLSQLGWGSDREATARAIEEVRCRIQESSTTFDEQLRYEIDADRHRGLQLQWLLLAFEGDVERVRAFLLSDFFNDLPVVQMSCRLWAKMLVDCRGRRVTPSDCTDVEVISSYLPYVDVFAGDNFMVNLINNLKLDTRYGTTVFSSKRESLRAFAEFLSRYLEAAESVNRPSLVVFVLPDAAIKADSFEFFRALGGAATRAESRWKRWIEVYAFDTGDLPRYRPHGVDIELPFFGLQSVEVLDLGRVPSSGVRRPLR